MQKIMNLNIQKNIKYSAYIGILNVLQKNEKITQDEYLKIREKIDKKLKKNEYLNIVKEMFFII